MDDEWQAWTGILNEAQARQLVATWAERSEGTTTREDRVMAKSLYVVTMPTTLVVVVEASDDKDAKTVGAKKADGILGNSVGVLKVVGDVKVTPIAAGKADKAKAKAKDKDEDEDEGEEEEEEEESDDEDEEEEEDEEESDDEDEDEEEEEEEEDEEEEEEDEKPAKKKGKGEKSDKKAGKKKVKIKLKG